MKAFAQLGVAAAIALAVGLLSVVGWPAFLVGAILAVSLWTMLFCGSCAQTERGTVGVVETQAYAVAAVLGTGLGYLMFRIGGDDNATWWFSGFIVAGVIMPATRSAPHHDR